MEENAKIPTRNMYTQSNKHLSKNNKDYKKIVLGIEKHCNQSYREVNYNLIQFLRGYVGFTILLYVCMYMIK